MKLSEARTLLEVTDKDTIKELVERFGEELVIECQKQGYSVGDMEEAYQGEYASDEDFAQNLAEDLDTVDKNSTWPMYCIDWEWAARELMMDYYEIDRHYFRSC
ncbi:hypothetical protein LCGC14_2542290 [marine sediment metagenome]|uniref:Uncharacterized protein n=1 Tax=marine sediment metagenome TaxID=412755 RepID=A0A0F9DIG8_9ZZZZ